MFPIPNQLATKTKDMEPENPVSKDSANHFSSSSSVSSINDDWILCDDEGSCWETKPSDLEVAGSEEPCSSSCPQSLSIRVVADDVNEDRQALKLVEAKDTADHHEVSDADELKKESPHIQSEAVEETGENWAQNHANVERKKLHELENMPVAQDDFCMELTVKQRDITEWIDNVFREQKLNEVREIFQQSQKKLGLINPPSNGRFSLVGFQPRRKLKMLNHFKIPKYETKTAAAISLGKRLDLLTATVGKEWVNPEAFLDTKNMGELVIQALKDHEIGISCFAKWVLGLRKNSLGDFLQTPELLENTKAEYHRQLYWKMLACISDAESIRLLRILTAEDATNLTLPQFPRNARAARASEVRDGHATLLPNESTDVQKHQILGKHEDSASVSENSCHHGSVETNMDKRNDELTIQNGESKAQQEDEKSIEIEGGRNKLKLTYAEFQPSEMPLDGLELVHVTAKFETLMAEILKSPNLQFVKMESVEIEASNGVVMTELELFDAFKEMVAFSPQGRLALNHVFSLPQMELQIGQITSESGRMLLYSSQKKSLVSSLPGIGRTLEMLSIEPPNFALSSLSLRDVTLEDSVALRAIFQNLRALSLKDVLFRQDNVTMPEMHPTLLQSLIRLVKFRVEETKGLDEPSIRTQLPTPHFPTTVKHLTLLEYASWYFKPPSRGVIFDYVHVTHMPFCGHVPVNTTYLSVPSLGLLHSALTADHLMPGSPLKQIWVDRSRELKNGSQETGVGVALLLKQTGINIKQKKFLLVRKNFEMPWKAETPSGDE